MVNTRAFECDRPALFSPLEASFCDPYKPLYNRRFLAYKGERRRTVGMQVMPVAIAFARISALELVQSYNLLAGVTPGKIPLF